MADEVRFGSASDLLVRKLIQARKERGFSLEEVSAETRIKKDHLEKIEAGNLTFLPAAYVYAFLKEYASALGVDDAELLESCRQELSIPTDLKVHQESSEEESAEEWSGNRLSGMFGAVRAADGKKNIVLLVGGGVLIVLVLLAVSYFMFSGSTGNEQASSEKETQAPPVVAEVKPEPADAVPDSVARADSLTDISQEKQGLAVQKEEWAKDVSFLPESPTSSARQVLVVRIVEESSWVKIIADDGDMEYPGDEYKAGEVLRFEAKQKFWVNIGRPPLVELYLNGEKVPPMSKRTIVLGEE